MTAQAQGSLIRPFHWLSVVAMLSLFPGCGSDLPPDTGGGTIRGAITCQCSFDKELISPYITILAMDETRYDDDGNLLVIFQSMFEQKLTEQDAIALSGVGMPYELKGLTPHDYYVYAAVTDIESDQWWIPIYLGVYKLGLDKVTVTNKAAAENINVIMYDY